MKSFEVNFDGLVGPTHNYAGLSYGNVASMSHKKLTSNPREAVLQGLRKMKALSDLGLVQGVLAPQSRPDIAQLRRIGFSGADDGAVLANALKTSPEILASVTSASSMWTANAATVSPSADSADGRVHFTAANLTAKLHRAIEHPTTTRVLRAMFADEKHFVHHPALPGGHTFGDEGAANHTRFCGADYGAPGVQFFVYGRVALDSSVVEPKKFPARQTREASEAIARLHGLRAADVVYGQQNPDAIDAGAFHNDVVSVGNQNVLFYHEHAFRDTDAILQALDRALAARGVRFEPVRVPASAVSLADAVKSYLFNSQLVTLPSGGMCLIAPRESLENASVKSYVDGLVAGGGPIREVKHFDLRQSMQNGGGPACLRLRVVLNESERRAANPAVFMNDDLHARLTAWAETHYRDRLELADLADVALMRETQTALDELTQILRLGSVYPFQTT